ncbi:hypothetical protein D3C72_1251130 [compost metagenome]
MIRIDRQYGHRQIQLAGHHRLLHRQPTQLGDFQLDARVGLAELTDQIGNLPADHGGNTQPQHAFFDRTDVFQLRLQLAELINDRQPALVYRLPAVGQVQFAAFADQQRAFQFFFQMAQHLADGRLGDEQFLRRAGKALLAHHFHEVAQGADIHVGFSWGKYRRETIP